MAQRVASAEHLAARVAVRDAVADLVEGTAVVVAVSGGPDSLALAGVAGWLAPRLGLSVHAVVVDHALQPDSAAVGERAAQECRRFGLTAEVVRVEVGTAGGPESAARDARYAALEDASARVAAPAVLLGHTREDQAETVLLRLARGSGARSLSGMRPVNGLWRRPFLGLARADVRRVAASLAGNAVWEDPHNADPAFARVRARALLEQTREALGDGAVLGLARTAELLCDDADALDALAAQAHAEVVSATNGEVAAACADLMAYPRAVRTRVLRLMALALDCPADELGYEHIAQLDALVAVWRGQGLHRLPGRVSASRAYGRLVLRRD